MAELLLEFAEAVESDGVRYKAQACGAPNSHAWEAWIEFIPLAGGPPIRSARETTQPNRDDAEYWASGLTPVYLQGALKRALNPVIRRVAVPAEPIFDGPAPISSVPSSATQPAAILDPFSVVEKGEGLLRQELSALSSWHLVNIIRAYELSDEPVAALNQRPAPGLRRIILEAVRARTTASSQGR